LKPGAAQARYQLGQIALAAGDLLAARQHHEAAMAIRREMNETRTIVESGLALAALALEEDHPADAERQAEAAVASGASTTAPMKATARLLVARARLMSRDVAGASGALAAARQLSGATERMTLRTGLAMVEAEIDAAQGRDREARECLAELQVTLARSGMVLGELERRLVLLRIDAAERRPNVKAAARSLEKDASARGAGLISRRARFL
jgi:hypothetical protein